MASSSRLKPGEKGRVSVSVDVKGKHGRLSKTARVFSNDPKKRVTVLSLKMHVKDSLHMEAHDAGALFTKRCRNCHVDRGKGKTGIALFRADCIMCHKKGGSASSLVEMRKKSREQVLGALRDGIENTSMPGFYKTNGGPLTDEEIESLIAVIKPH